MREIEVRALLQAEADRLDRELAVIRSELAEFAGGQGPEGETERADEIATEHVELQNDRLRLVDLERQRAEVSAALDRVGSGTYGRCEVCDAPIPDERLDAIPWTRVCVLHA